MQTTQSRFTLLGNVTLTFCLCLGGRGLALAKDLDPQVVGHWSGQGTGSIAALAVSGNRAYVAQSESGLHVLDISDRANPAQVGSFATTTDLHALALQSHRAYLAAGSNGLLIIDVSDSVNPRLLGEIKTGGKALDVAVSGHYAYVAEDTTGLQVIDVSNPSAPRWVGGYEVTHSDGADTRTVGAVGVIVVDDHVCLAGGEAGLVIIDVSRPESPHLVATYPSDYSGRSTWGVDYNGTYVFAEFPFGLEIIDLATPANPKKVSGPFGAEEYTFPDFAVCGDIVVMEESHLFDVSNPHEPRRVGFLGLGMWGNVSAAISGSHLYVGSSGTPGLNVFELRVANPQQIGRWTNGITRAVVGNLAYSLVHPDGLQIVDVSDPREPMLVGRFNTTGLETKLAVAGAYAFLLDRDLPGDPGTGQGFLVVDVSNVSSPELVGSIPEMHDWLNVRDIDAVGETVYVSESEFGLHIIDVSDPNTPRRLGGLPPLGSPRGLAVVGTHGYWANYTRQELQIISVASSANPQLIGAYATGGPTFDVTVQGGYAFVAAGSAGLLILDLSDPANPQHVATFKAFVNALAVSVSGDYAFIGNDPGGLQVLNVADKRHPRLVGRNTSHGGYPVYALDDSICIAGGRILEMLPFFNQFSTAGGTLQMSWESFGKARLQHSTSLTAPNWQELIGFENTNRVTLPLRIGSEFFRLVKQ